jgi:hypothetical protein
MPDLKLPNGPRDSNICLGYNKSGDIQQAIQKYGNKLLPVLDPEPQIFPYNQGT